jgi:hypothetical protein
MTHLPVFRVSHGAGRNLRAGDAAAPETPQRHIAAAESLPATPIVCVALDDDCNVGGIDCPSDTEDMPIGTVEELAPPGESEETVAPALAALAACAVPAPTTKPSKAVTKKVASQATKAAEKVALEDEWTPISLECVGTAACPVSSLSLFRSGAAHVQGLFGFAPYSLVLLRYSVLDYCDTTRFIVHPRDS